MTFRTLNTLKRHHHFELKGSMLLSGPVVGSKVEVEHAFDASSVEQFAKICGDNNPIHIDPEYAKKSIFGGTIVHGMLLSSLFSTLFGRSIPSSIYVSQTLQFKAPVHVGTPVKASLTVIKSEEKKKGFFITCMSECRIISTGILAITGESVALIPTEIHNKLVKKQ
jgi:acyl dehydratase